METEKEQKIEYINEPYIKVSESRVKYAFAQYKLIKSYKTSLSICISGFISFLSAFVTTYFTNNFIGWISILIICMFFLLLSIFFGIKQLILIKKGLGSEEWFMSIIKNIKFSNRDYLDNYTKKKKKFYTINFILIVLIPLIILLSVLGSYGWSISNYKWAPVFWVIWSSILALYVVFGTYINAYFAQLLFGFDANDFLP